MALKFREEYKGILAEYWKLIELKQDFATLKSIAILALYKDEQIRRRHVSNYLKIEKVELGCIDLSRADAYTEIKKPVYEKTPDGRQIQTNKFVKAEDC